LSTDIISLLNESQTVTILDGDAVRRALTRIAHEILERNGGPDDLVLLGVRTRGVPLAQRIASLIRQFEDVDVPVHELDATAYRDDRKGVLVREPGSSPSRLAAEEIEGKRIVLVDDVFYTGRTVRAAIDAIIDVARPANIQLAVLVDRGHRELPIRADYVGKNVPTSRHERINVRLKETDDADEVILERKT
jgi:pyrimidine operon attenuation protein/uracil phosphoribosyltransferase